MVRTELETNINTLWELHDEAQNAGDKDLAADFASRAFQLLEKLPENLVYISTKH